MEASSLPPWRHPLTVQVAEAISDSEGASSYFTANAAIHEVGNWLGQKAIERDRIADETNDGVKKMQAASLAAAANELLSVKV